MEGLRIADLRVDDVLPAEHAGGLLRSGHVHPRGDLRHRAGIEDLPSVCLFDTVADAGDRGARLAGEEEALDAETTRVDALLLGNLGEVERERWRAVERLRLHEAHPKHRARAHSGRAGAEGERLGAEALRPAERATTAHVEAQ